MKKIMILTAFGICSFNSMAADHYAFETTKIESIKQLNEKTVEVAFWKKCYQTFAQTNVVEGLKAPRDEKLDHPLVGISVIVLSDYRFDCEDKVQNGELTSKIVELDLDLGLSSGLEIIQPSFFKEE